MRIIGQIPSHRDRASIRRHVHTNRRIEGDCVDTVDLHGFGCRVRRHDGGDEDGELRDGRDDQFEREHRDRDRDCEERR
jgi:hypothetical protein